MPTHAEKRVLPYTREQLFNLVAEVERYPEFLPWCVSVRVRDRETIESDAPDGQKTVIRADLMIGFRMLREKFTSRVTLSAPDRIDVAYLDGPFRYLNNHWVFEPRDGGCEIDFFVDFEFRSRILRRLMEPLFNEAVRRMVGAFETRARALYGKTEPCAPLHDAAGQHP
jgi:coenzyme Q-binding protein COQ10